MGLFLRSLILSVIASAGAIFVATSSSAYYCSEPIPPSCAIRYGVFDDQDDFDQCKRKMGYFKAEVETFLSCLQDETERARSTYNDPVDSFNRRARG